MTYPYTPKVQRLENGLFAINGTMYGFLHTTGGDIRTWNSYSGAYKAAIRYRDRYDSMSGATCAFIREYDPEYDNDYSRLETDDRGAKMKNPVVDMAPFGKVYKRKIDVFMRQVDTNGKPISCTGWVYLHSTNAYPRCIDASRSASFGKGSHFQYKAWFAK